MHDLMQYGEISWDVELLGVFVKFLSLLSFVCTSSLIDKTPESGTDTSSDHFGGQTLWWRGVQRHPTLIVPLTGPELLTSGKADQLCSSNWFE